MSIRIEIIGDTAEDIVKTLKTLTEAFSVSTSSFVVDKDQQPTQIDVPPKQPKAKAKTKVEASAEVPAEEPKTPEEPASEVLPTNIEELAVKLTDIFKKGDDHTRRKIREFLNTLMVKRAIDLKPEHANIVTGFIYTTLAEQAA